MGRKNLPCNMSQGSRILQTLSEGIQCELGKESYRNFISSLKRGQSEGGDEPFSECQGIDLSMRQEKLLINPNIKTENDPYESYKSDAEDRSIVVEVDPSIYSPVNDVEFSDYICGDCGIQYPDGAAYETHCKAHDSIEPFKCIECSLRFQDYDTFDLHKEIHSVKRYNCTDCKKKYSFKWSLMMHSQIHRSRPQLRCEKCGLLFLNDEYLSSHSRLHHITETPVVMDIQSSSPLDLDGQNKEEYQTVLNSILDCEHCDLKFESKSDLVNHQKMHYGSLMFKCEICETLCTSYSDLREHVQSNHDDLDVHFCENCGGTGFVSQTSEDDDDEEPRTSTLPTTNLEVLHCTKGGRGSSVKEKPVSKITGAVAKKNVKIKKSSAQEKHIRTLRSVKRKTKTVLKKVSFEVKVDQNRSRKFCELKFKKDPFLNKKRSCKI